MSLPARDDVNPEYRFDLTRIFETPAEWEAAATALREDLDALESRTEESLETPADLRVLLERVEDCYRRKQRLDLYATLYENVNTGAETAGNLQRRFRDLESEFEPVVAAVKRRLRETDDQLLDSLLAELDDYRRYAESLREQAGRVRSSDAEDAIAADSEVRSAPTRIIEAVTTEDFDPPSVERPDGEQVALRYGNFRDELSHPNREYRKRVYEAYRGEMDRFEHVLSRAYAEKLAAASAEVEVRGYDSVRDRDFRGTYPETGLEPRLPGEVHDAMLDAVRDNLGPFHRSQEIRRERLGVETLRPWDLSVSIADAPEPEIPYEKATEYILSALAPLGDDYVARTRSFFEDRRIDVYPTQDKRTDIPAYCPSSAADGAFVLANYREDVWSMSVVAHELGHALNVSYHREGPTRYATCPTAICEIPSILHEILLAEHWFDRGGALADHAKNRLLEVLGGNFYGSAMGSAFDHRLATAVEDGEDLSAERIREVYADLLAEFRPAVEYADRAGRDWLGRGMRDPYSSFQYVLGATGALVVRNRLREGSLTPAEYRDFLRQTGRRDLPDQFDALGIDVTSAEPYERAAETFAGYLDEF
ncbi:M3 family metallopeptidase [Halorussus gelatinilyticus]|uniref:M3 family metallopeptidase n=1 Tax=Halorussus gelatinilyticus TaxID=2937524 RepID=A0A8U0IIM5_9EURY|nr:M3 family metallopeptidase [Halorussus gelatinilyticus]UPW00545.1 M3 family metallopeptidase [Halorussus gelatinilyticus]